VKSAKSAQSLQEEHEGGMDMEERGGWGDGLTGSVSSQGFSDNTGKIGGRSCHTSQSSLAHDPTLGPEGGQQEAGEGGEGGKGGGGEEGDDGSEHVMVAVDVEKLELMYKHVHPYVRVNKSMTTKVRNLMCY
jgi:hypothetical protein